MIHCKTSVKGVIERLATLGLSITYNRVSEIQEQVMKQEIKRFDEMGLVCPRNLKPSIFTTAAKDNIDHNSTSSTAQNRFQYFNILQINLSYKYKTAYQENMMIAAVYLENSLISILKFNLCQK